MSKPAEAAKQRGNELFGKGRHAAAREAYTEAIALDATVSTFYSNRALCAKALGDWAAVEVDAQKALETERNNTKGGYLLGLCLCRRREWAEGVAALGRCREMARREQKPQSFQQEVLFALRQARKDEWHDGAPAHDAALDASAELAEGLLASCEGGEESAAAAEKLRALCEAAKRASRAAWPIPDHLCCRISMELFVDPVCTPHGHSFERSCIERHLGTSATDPLTRRHLTKAMLVPNLALKDAADAFLEENPWAWRE